MSHFKPIRHTSLTISCCLLLQSPAFANPIDAEAQAITTATPIEQPIDETLKDDLRLETIGYRIAVANPMACAHPENLTGLLLQDLASYDESIRPAIAKRDGLSYGVGVRGVVNGSAAALAGLQKNDEILSVNGQSLQDFDTSDINHLGSSQRIEKFIVYLMQALDQGATQLVVNRTGTKHVLTLTGSLGCSGHFVAVPSHTLNAWADGHYVAVTTRMMNYVANDDELAFVVAHEMSHNILEHVAKLHGKSMLLATFGLGSSPFRHTEEQADDYAISLLAHTDFNLSAPENLLKRLENNILMKVSIDFTHPSLGNRIEIVRQALAREANSNLAWSSGNSLVPQVSIKPSLVFSSITRPQPEYITPLLSGFYVKSSLLDQSGPSHQGSEALLIGTGILHGPEIGETMASAKQTPPNMASLRVSELAPDMSIAFPTSALRLPELLLDKAVNLSYIPAIPQANNNVALANVPPISAQTKTQARASNSDLR